MFQCEVGKVKGISKISLSANLLWVQYEPPKRCMRSHGSKPFKWVKSVYFTNVALTHHFILRDAGPWLRGQTQACCLAQVLSRDVTRYQLCENYCSLAPAISCLHYFDSLEPGGPASPCPLALGGTVTLTAHVSPWLPSFRASRLTRNKGLRPMRFSTLSTLALTCIWSHFLLRSSLSFFSSHIYLPALSWTRQTHSQANRRPCKNQGIHHATLSVPEVPFPAFVICVARSLSELRSPPKDHRVRVSFPRHPL